MDHVGAKAVSVKASVDPKATAAERAMTIVLFWLEMFLRYTTLVLSTKVGIPLSVEGFQNPSGISCFLWRILLSFTSEVEPQLQADLSF